MECPTTATTAAQRWMVMGMYKAPIHLIQQQIQAKIEGEVLTAVHKIHVEVDKDELLRALQYDRDQYNKGYADGEADAMDSIVRCKDCKHCFKSNLVWSWFDAKRKGSEEDESSRNPPV